MPKSSAARRGGACLSRERRVSRRGRRVGDRNVGNSDDRPTGGISHFPFENKLGESRDLMRDRDRRRQD